MPSLGTAASAIWIIMLFGDILGLEHPHLNGPLRALRMGKWGRDLGFYYFSISKDYTLDKLHDCFNQI
jgi:hypothetical protein